MPTMHDDWYDLKYGLGDFEGHFTHEKEVIVDVAPENMQFVESPSSSYDLDEDPDVANEGINECVAMMHKRASSHDRDRHQRYRDRPARYHDDTRSERTPYRREVS